MSIPTAFSESDEGKVPDVEYCVATKAYDNSSWLHSRGARHVRIMCEYLETQNRLRREGVFCSILFFGSARGQRREVWERDVREAKEALAHCSVDADKRRLEEKVEVLRKVEWMCEYWEKAYLLSKKITEWAQTADARKALCDILAYMPSPVTAEGYDSYDASRFLNPSTATPLVVCTGGGPGLMEAVNCGAHSVPGGRNMGMGISLPHEPGLNKWINPELAFKYHYFFTRKFWMVYISLGLIVMPGGLGTVDELMEVLTLKQTGKVKRDIPVVLLGKRFWKQAINFEFFLEHGAVDEKDLKQLFFTDDVDEAFEFIRKTLMSETLIYKHHKSTRLRQPPAV